MVDLLMWAFMVAVLVSVFILAGRDLQSRQTREDVLRSGVQLEAEILARFEAGATQGSELAKARQPLMAPWDPLELELRYVFNGREIVSRRRVSSETFFHTRSMNTLRIKVLPGQPEEWAALE
jgi:hypothetical protein